MMEAEWIERSDTGVSEWLQEAFAVVSDEDDWLESPETSANADAGPGTDDLDPAVIQATAQLVGQLVPLIAQGVAAQRRKSDAGNNPETVDDEGFGAVIGAIASALPVIIPAVRNLVGAVQRSRRRRRVPRQRVTPPAPTVTVTSCPAGCTPAPARTPAGIVAQGEEESAAAVAALVPVLVQLLPALIPLITDLLIPLLTKTLPALISKQGRKPRARRSRQGETSPEAIVDDALQYEGW